MRVKKDKIDLPELIREKKDKAFDCEKLEAHKMQIIAYLRVAREHVELLKQELYKVIDAGFDDASGYNLSPEEVTEVDYGIAPSAFLEKAYTKQSLDTNERNRYQSYINAGQAFANYCDNSENKLNVDQTLLNDAGKLVGAINNLWTQTLRTKDFLVDDAYEEASSSLEGVENWIDALISSAEESNIIKVIPHQSGFQKILSDLKDFFYKLVQFFANLGKNEVQVHKETFNKIREEYLGAANKDVATKECADADKAEDNKEMPSTAITPSK